MRLQAGREAGTLGTWLPSATSQSCNGLMLGDRQSVVSRLFLIPGTHVTGIDDIHPFSFQESVVQPHAVNDNNAGIVRTSSLAHDCGVNRNLL